MDDNSSTECTCEVVQVAIVNKDSLEDKLKEHAVLAIAGGVVTLIFSQTVPWITKKTAAVITARREKKKNQEKD